MAAETPKTTSSADSYIGSLISLTSKSEIRYEGVLYSINTDESSIGLRNVRSFGTEGRKKDGPQVAPSDKVYEYILFRGSDIKDLQVKSSPPIQASSSSSIDNDPAIIQSHYPRPDSTAANLPPAATSSSADVNVHAPHLGHPGSGFPGALPLYQPGGSLGSWGPSPPPGANASGLAMPMYWPGFYGPSNGLPHMHQQTLLRPPPGLSVPPSLQQPMQYPGFSPSISGGATNLTGSKLPDIPPSLVPSSATSTVLTTSLPQASLAPMPSASLASETFPGAVGPKALNFNLLPTANLPSVSLLTASAADTSAAVPATSNVVNAVSSSTLPNLSLSQTIGSIVSCSVPSQTEIPTPSLVTPDQLMQSEQIPMSSSPSEVHKDVEVVQVLSSSSSQPKVQAHKEAQPPILPLPPQSRAFHKPSGPPQQHHNYNYRGRGRGTGRGRGRGNLGSRPVTRFTEDFDFEAMNEKFNKDEVWGNIGKSHKSHEGVATAEDGDDSEVESEDVPKVDVKPLYNKDDFFDTLSCNTVDNDSQNGRPRFSEQLKLDAETFGDFVRYRGGRGGRGPGRGGRGRGSYYGSYYGRGYGYNGRGRGRGMANQSS